MGTWMANWIRLPARPSNSIYGSALTVLKPTRRMVRSFVRSAAQLLITRRRQDYVNEFNPRCEKRWINVLRAMLRQTRSRCSREGGRGRRGLAGERRGIG